MVKTCLVDGKPFEAKRAAAKYCSERCKKRAQRGQGPNTVVQLPARSVTSSSVVDSTRAELAAAGRLDTYLGQAALAAADRLDSSRAVQGYSGLLKEYRDTMREAMADVERDADTADDLRSAALRLIGGT